MTEKGKRVDALINNAYPKNLRYGKPVLEVEFEDFCDNNQHMGGYFLTMQRYTVFLKHGGGNILNMGSDIWILYPLKSVELVLTMPVGYAAIKASILHLTRYFAQHLKKMGFGLTRFRPNGLRDSDLAIHRKI